MTKLQVESTTASPIKIHSPPPTYLEVKVHHLEPQVTANVNEYFLKNWSFQNQKEIDRFIKIQCGLCICYSFADAADDRIELITKYFAATFFLIDDYMENLSFAEAKLLAEKLAAISRKETPPDRSIPMEWVIYDIFEEMRAMDPKNGEDTVEATIIYWKSQANEQRASFKDLGSCMTYRMIDSASEAASPVNRFGIKLHMTPEECELVKELDYNRSRHISLNNDIVSWDKEVRQAQESTQDGSHLCSCVQVAMNEFSIDLTAAKRMLWFLIREFELRHLELTAKLLSTHPHLALYCRSLEYNMSGDEAWGRVSPRYHNLDS